MYTNFCLLLFQQRRGKPLSPVNTEGVKFCCHCIVYEVIVLYVFLKEAAVVIMHGYGN